MARTFDGVDDILTLANEGNFDFERTDAFSIAAWLWIDTPIAIAGAIVAKQASGGNQTGYRLFFGSDNLIGVQIRSGPGDQAFKRDDTAFPDSTWTHVVMTYSGSSTTAGINFYQNAVLSTSTTSVADTLSASILNNDSVTIGGRTAGVDWLAARVAGVIVDNVEWTAAQVNRLYWTGMPPRGFAGTKSYHPFWSDDLNDKGASGGNATASGTTMVSGPPKVGRAPALLFSAA